MNKFEVNDKVVLLDADGAVDDWTGVTGTVMKINEDPSFGELQICPSVDRPDGYGRNWFYWSSDLARKVEE
jgi:hypothetical protein